MRGSEKIDMTQASVKKNLRKIPMNFLPNYNASSLPSNRQVFFAGDGVLPATFYKTIDINKIHDRAVERIHELYGNKGVPRRTSAFKVI
jgi:hypothetical protein